MNPLGGPLYWICRYIQFFRYFQQYGSNFLKSELEKERRRVGRQISRKWDIELSLSSYIPRDKTKHKNTIEKGFTEKHKM